jgi:F-type H+-transporting ATPase subunit a
MGAVYMIPEVLNAGGHYLAESGNLMNEVAPIKLFTTKIGGFTIEFTNHMAMVLVVALLMILIFPIMAGQSKKSPVPKGLRNFFEAILSFLRTEVFRPALGENTDRFVPFLWTVFFFILLCNLIGMIPLNPFIVILKHKTNIELPEMAGAATANLSITVALALVMFFAIHISGIIQQIRIQLDPTLDPHFGHHQQEGGVPAATDHHGHEVATASAHGASVHGKALPVAVPLGVLMYIKNFVPAVPLFLWPLMFVLEIIGALVKPFALAVRLFANMLAGHLILGALIALIPVVGVGIGMTMEIAIPVILGASALQILELFVAFLQAYIFTFLTTLFIASAVAPEH